MPDTTPAKPDVRQAILDNLDALWAKSPPKLKPLLATTLRAAQVATHLPTGHCLQLKPEACSALMDFLYAACPPLETMDLGVVQATPTAAAETPEQDESIDVLRRAFGINEDVPDAVAFGAMLASHAALLAERDKLREERDRLKQKLIDRTIIHDRDYNALVAAMGVAEKLSNDRGELANEREALLARPAEGTTWMPEVPPVQGITDLAWDELGFDDKRQIREQYPRWTLPMCYRARWSRWMGLLVPAPAPSREPGEKTGEAQG
jgi:hypothetical protein